jgi:RNA polymerase sigma-B factor
MSVDRRTPHAAAEASDRFERHRRLAHAAAGRYRRTPHAADVQQVADIALWLAATRYDVTKGPFERFAVVTIAGEIKKHLRQAGWSVHVSRRQQEDALRLRSVIDTLTSSLGRTPTTGDVLASTGWTTDRLAAAFRCDAGRFAMSTDRPDAPDVPGADRSTSVDDEVDVDSAVAALPELERTIVWLTYRREMTQREIAAALAITQSQVHRALRRAHDRIAGALAPG